VTQTVNIRASSIASIIDCPKRGLSLALGLVKQLPSTAPAIIGSACHESTAAFDKAAIEGCPITADEATQVIVDYIKHPKDEVYWGDTTTKEAERRAIGVHTRYCMDIAPDIDYEQVELTLDPMEIDCGDGLVIVLTGTLDRVYKEIRTYELEYYDGHGILDVKSGVRACTQKPGKHKGQLGVYELLAERALGVEMNLPGLIGRLQTSNQYEVDVVAVENTKEALIGNDEETGLLGHIARMLKSGDFYGNSSSWLCSERYCPLYKGCIFR